MRNTDNNRPAFVLTTANVYVPGSLPEEIHAAAPKGAGGGCCGSGPTPTQSQEKSSGCGTSGCDTGATAQESTGCC